MKHHYIPQFYLRAWYAPDEEKTISYTRDPKGRLRFDYKPSKSICFSPDLYTIQPDGFLSQQEINDEIETKFFQSLDNSSSIAHQILLTKGVSGLNDEQRHTWSKFVISLMERNPKNIEELSKKSLPEIKQTIKELLEKSPSENFRSTAEKLIKDADIHSVARNATLWAMKKYISEDPITEKIKAMEWWAIDINNEKEHFLTCDNPVLINNGKGREPILSMSLALSPKRLLVITQRHPDIDDEFVRTLATTHSLQMCRQANHLLISSRRLEKGRYTNYISAAESLFRREHTRHTRSGTTMSDE